MDNLFIGCAKVCVLLLALLVLACLVRAVRGPRIADRIVACNMIGTMTICIIAILGTVMEQSWLYDICLIYAMISFLAVVVLSRIYTGAYRASQKQKQEQEQMNQSTGSPTDSPANTPSDAPSGLPSDAPVDTRPNPLSESQTGEGGAATPSGQATPVSSKPAPEPKAQAASEPKTKAKGKAASKTQSQPKAQTQPKGAASHD